MVSNIFLVGFCATPNLAHVGGSFKVSKLQGGFVPTFFSWRIKLIFWPIVGIFRKYLSCLVIVLSCTLLLSALGFVSTSIGFSDKAILYLILVVALGFFGWQIYTRYKSNGD